MFRPDLIVRSRAVVLPAGVQPRAIHIRNGRIVGVLEYDCILADCQIDDAGDDAVLPGVVDIDGAAAGHEQLADAAAAGITTLIARTPAIRDVDALQRTRQTYDGRAPLDIGFWGSASAANGRELRALYDAGVFGFTCERLWEKDLRTVIPALWHLQAMMIVHGADEIARLLPLCHERAPRIHLLGLGSPETLTALYHARAARLPMTAGTQLDFLTTAAEQMPRGRESREFLWASLAHGLLQTISSGHLATMWIAARERRYTLDKVAEWLCAAPAKLAGLTRKGRIDVGYDADLVVFDAARAAIRRTYLRGASPRGKVLTRY